MKLLRIAVAFALLCAPLAANAQVQYRGDFGANVNVGPQTPLPVALGVDAAGNPTAGATTRTVVAFRQTCSTSAVQMASNALSNGAVIKALSTNSGTAYIGRTGVTTSTGYPLAAGEAISYGVANTSQLYLICSDATSVVAVTGN